MTYVGQQPATTFDSGIQDRFTGLTTNTVTLNHEISAEEDILVVWNNIVQDKNTYSVGGTGNKTVTLGGTLVSADVVTVYYLNKVMQSVNPTAGSVGLTQLSATGTASSSNFLRGDNSWQTPSGFDVTSITGATALAVEPALTDEMVLSDAGTLKRLDMQHVMNVPAFHAYMSTSQNFASGTGATVEYNTERFDIGSCYNTTDYKFTPGVAGWYWLYGVNYFASGIDDGEQHASFVRKNGTDIYRYGYTEIQSARTDMTSMGTFNIIVYADADDYFECRVWQNSGSTLSLNRDYGSWGGFRITGVDSSAPSSGPPEN